MNRKSLILVVIILACHNLVLTINNPTTQNYLYNKNVSLNDPLAAMRLMQESYITPEMQWEVLSILNEDDFTFNRFTGHIEDLPSVTELLGIVQEKMQNLRNPAQKEVLKNGLRTMLEANEIATFVANVEAALANPAFIFYQTVDSQLLATLKNEKSLIQSTISAVNSINVGGEQSSYFSWLWGSSDTKKQPTQQIDSNITVQINPQSPLVTLPAALMPSIIKNNDYKQMQDPNRSANLLFKQCFIAQQHHLKDFNRIKNLGINLSSPVSATNYIYTNFPDFNKICSIARDIIPADQYRTSLNDIVTQEQIQAHQLLSHIRQAIQTAIYISNKKSEVNLGYLLPQSVKSYLDSTLNQLALYESTISELCKDPRYGATPQDVYQDEQRTTILKYAGGIIATAATAGALYAYAPAAAGYAVQQSSNLANWWKGGTPALPPVVQNPVNGPVDGPVQGPIQQQNNQMNGGAEKAKSYYDYVPSLTTIGKAGELIAMAGAATSITGATIKNAGGDQAAADLLLQTGQKITTAGSLAGGLTGTLSGVGGAISTASSFVDGTAGAVGRAVGATTGAIGAGYNVYNQGLNPQTAFGAYMSGNNALISNIHAYKQLTATTPQQDNVNIKTLSPQDIYNIFVNLITKTLQDGGNVLQKMYVFIEYLFKNQLAPPALVSTILQQLPPELSTNPQVAEPVSQLVDVLNKIQ